MEIAVRDRRRPADGSGASPPAAATTTTAAVAASRAPTSTPRARASSTSSTGRATPTRRSSRASRRRPAARSTTRLAGTSDEMFTKFRSGGGGQYDLASFSGDASLRAIKSGSVAPLDTSKLTNYNDLAPQLQSPDVQHAGRQALRPVVHVGRQRPDLQRGQGQARPRTRGPCSTTPSTRARSPSRTTRSRSPTRRCSSSARRTRTRSTRRRSTRSRRKLKQQRPLVRKYWVLATDFEQLFKSGDATIGAGWPLMTNDLKKAGHERQGGHPEGGRDRVVGLVDALQEGQAPDLRLQVHELRDHARQSQAKVADVTGYSPAEPEDLRGRRARSAARTCTSRDKNYYDTIKYWETPIAPTNYRQWTDAWAEVQRLTHARISRALYAHPRGRLGLLLGPAVVWLLVFYLVALVAAADDVAVAAGRLHRRARPQVDARQLRQAVHRPGRAVAAHLRAHGAAGGDRHAGRHRARLPAGLVHGAGRRRRSGARCCSSPSSCRCGRASSCGSSPGARSSAARAC